MSEFSKVLTEIGVNDKWIQILEEEEFDLDILKSTSDEELVSVLKELGLTHGAITKIKM